MSDKDIEMIPKGMSEAVEYSGNPNKDDEEAMPRDVRIPTKSLWQNCIRH